MEYRERGYHVRGVYPTKVVCALLNSGTCARASVSMIIRAARRCYGFIRIRAGAPTTYCILYRIFLV